MPAREWVGHTRENALEHVADAFAYLSECFTLPVFGMLSSQLGELHRANYREVYGAYIEDLQI